VFVCDGLQLCYRPCSCDAVLSIAVLHHISSRQRRLALLQQLAGVLRPGGRGLVTVWATQQDDPAKTIQRWHKIQPTEHTQEEAVQQQHGQQQQQQQQVQQEEGGVVEGPDYFVPWHLPLHKAAGLAAATSSSNGVESGCSSNGGAAAAAPSVVVDAAKRAVVLQRYYHLFEEGELEGLVAQVPCVEVVRVFFDRSNWCVEFLKL
jgi:alkylated DNA repair protein alkB family protein 8